MFQFPFGQPVLPLRQVPHRNARVFVLGVYASAVHARWLAPDGRELVKALAVASEPCIFWRGDGAPDIIQRLQHSLPEDVGTLEPPASNANGPSGVSLDEDYLAPLGLTREHAWLCDLLPESRMNDAQHAKLALHYRPLAQRFGLPEVTVPRVPGRFADQTRLRDIEREFLESGAETLITLGDVPLREFAVPLRIGQPRLRWYGTGDGEYGQLHPFTLCGRRFNLLPLVHPRQARGLGASQREWRDTHARWKEQGAGSLGLAWGHA